MLLQAVAEIQRTELGSFVADRRMPFRSAPRFCSVIRDSSAVALAQEEAVTICAYVELRFGGRNGIRHSATLIFCSGSANAVTICAYVELFEFQRFSISGFQYFSISAFQACYLSTSSAKSSIISKARLEVRAS